MVRSRLRILASAATVVVGTCLSAATLRAENVPSLLIDATYSRPLRWNFGGSLFLPSDDWTNEGGSGLIVGGSVGRHGMQMWGGSKILGFGGGDFRAVLTKTWATPRGASPNSTYVGGEIGFGGMFGRLSVGYARRLAGVSTGSDHMVTWSVGMDLPLLWRQRPRPTSRPAAQSTERH